MRDEEHTIRFPRIGGLAPGGLVVAGWFPIKISVSKQNLAEHEFCQRFTLTALRIRSGSSALKTRVLPPRSERGKCNARARARRV